MSTNDKLEKALKYGALGAVGVAGIIAVASNNDADKYAVSNDAAISGKVGNGLHIGTRDIYIVGSQPDSIIDAAISYQNKDEKASYAGKKAIGFFDALKERDARRAKETRDLRTEYASNK